MVWKSGEVGSADPSSIALWIYQDLNPISDSYVLFTKNNISNVFILRPTRGEITVVGFKSSLLWATVDHQLFLPRAFLVSVSQEQPHFGLHCPKCRSLSLTMALQLPESAILCQLSHLVGEAASQER